MSGDNASLGHETQLDLAKLVVILAAGWEDAHAERKRRVEKAVL